MDSKRLNGRRKVVVYPITGRQLPFLSIPHGWCKECELTARAVRKVAHDLDGRVDVEIRPWLRHAFEVLSKGGWHAPVVTIDGRLFSQGVVPDQARLKAALLEEVPVS